MKRLEVSSSCALVAGVLVMTSIADRGHAQGCVVARGAGPCATTPGGFTNHLDVKWQVALAYRWLNSDRHFVGDVEQKHRHVTGNQVINDSHFIDLGVSYSFTPRWGATVVLPYVHHDRTSWYEHTRTNRHRSSSRGLGDVRFALTGWVLDPAKMPSGNLQFGIGFKAPTGDFAATDTFTTVNGPVVGSVDQSIQPGDGGWGLTLDFNGYQTLGAGVYGFAQGSYLANPRDVNGTSTRSGTARGNPFEQEMSVADSYLVRGGLGYAIPWVKGLVVTLAGRVEGVAVRDLIGDDNGFRRPGYAVSIEPGLNLMAGRWNFAVSAPVLMYANRQRSVADERFTESSGVYRHGDAAFASFLVSASVARVF